MSTVIDARGVCKEYVRQAVLAPRYRTLNSTIAQWGARLLGGRAETSAGDERFWALRDVSFTIEEGEVVGVIGHNGSGKSTLLKIISRITAPTAGEIRLDGRVGSLLEVGTGFHPELTGRENIFLNGAILGMRQREIREKFDEIVAFSGIEEFIETPVKRYSSGMQMRLAFSVAAHLDTDLLFVDEVLAVGDADFRKKCLGKMHDAARSGRTVLFVSHNMNSIRQLCGRVLWLDHGRLVEDTVDVYHAVGRLLFGSERVGSNAAWRAGGENGLETPVFSLVDFRVCDQTGDPVSQPIGNDRLLQVALTVDVHQLDPKLGLGYAVISEAGEVVFMTLSTDAGRPSLPALALGQNKLVCELPNRILNEGRYKIDFIARIGNGWLSEPLHARASVTVEIGGDVYAPEFWRGPRSGILAPVYAWHRVETQRAERPVVKSEP
jgi:lipopolysaccharide transport system ATP-binding protein